MKPWPLISQQKGRWILDTNRKLPRRQRRIFDTEKEAKAYADQLRKQIHQHGVSSLLTFQQQADALTALTALASANLPGTVLLTDAARFYVIHHGTTGAKLSDIFDEWEASKRSQGLREKYTDNLRTPRRQLLEWFGDRVMATITARELSDFFATCPGIEDPSKPLSPGSVHYRYRYSRNLWLHAKLMEHVSIDPFEKMKPPKVPETQPQILKIDQAAALVATAQQPEYEPFLAYVVLGLFCGIRSEELSKLRWTDLRNLETVMITAANSKKGRARDVPIPLNARLLLDVPADKVAKDDFIIDLPDHGPKNAWMDARRAERKNGMVNFWHRWLDFTKAAGISPWPPNAMRHSFASYFYVTSGNDTKLTQDRLGHEQRETLFRHYVQQVPDREGCLPYWMIGAEPKINALIQPFRPMFKQPDWPGLLKTLNLSR